MKQQPDNPSADRVGHSTNLVGVGTAFLASTAYNDAPVPLEIAGSRSMNASLFEMLDDSPTLDDAAEAFHKYMAAVFGLEPDQREVARRRREEGGVRRLRSSYLRLLRSWGWDSNGPEGAVLKGWVESRFGLFPTFHKAPVDSFSGTAWAGYVEEKMSSRFHNNAIHAQLDILYAFCQWALIRREGPPPCHLTLYRGVNDFTEHPVRERLGKGDLVIRLNSLSSFTADREVADCFGDTILTARVPLPKVVFFTDLLPGNPLKAESEFLVIGGDYRVKAEIL